MTSAIVTLAAEGIIDFAILRRLTRDAGLRPGNEYGGRGKSKFDASLAGYNKAAAYGPWLAARDMDHDAVCPIDLVSRLLPNPARTMRFRIVVRSAEAWLLADRKHFGDKFRIALKYIPDNPEALDHPKIAMLSALAKSSSKNIRTDMVRLPQAIGPQYNSILRGFAESGWNPEKAEKTAPSLARARKRLTEFADILIP